MLNLYYNDIINNLDNINNNIILNNIVENLIMFQENLIKVQENYYENEYNNISFYDEILALNTSFFNISNNFFLFKDDLENSFKTELQKIIDLRLNIEEYLELFDYLDLNLSENQSNISTNNKSINISFFCDTIDYISSNDSYFIYPFKNEKYYIYNNIVLNSTKSSISCEELEEGCPFNFTNEKFVFLDNKSYSYIGKMLMINDRTSLLNFKDLICTEKINFENKNISKIKTINLNEINEEIKKIFPDELIEPTSQCCIFNQCSQCCYDESCRNDNDNYPMLLLHGHSVLKSTPADWQTNSYNKIILNLIEDGYIDAGVINYDDPYSSTDLEWSYFTAPLVAKATYYYDYYFNLGSYIYITKKNEKIDTYAIRLSEIIKNMQRKTGKDKVDIIAHSMGGLVVRRYLQIFGYNSVNNVLLIGTPNNGVDGRISFFCPVFGHSSECEDMQKDSIFLLKLNDPNYIPEININTISGIGCNMKDGDGDGVVSLNSSLISYAKSYIINGSCSDLLETSLHTELLNLDLYPETYEIIKEVFKID